MSVSAINIDKLLCVNGYHGSGYIPAEDRRLLADYVRQLGEENEKLRAAAILAAGRDAP